MHAIFGETHERFESFFCAVVRIKKRDKKRSNLSLCVRSNTNTHATFTNDLISLSLSLSFFPSVRANGEERRRREKEEEEISRKKRYLDDEEEQRLRPVAFGWCER